MERRYPALNAELARQLSIIPLTDGLYRPCKVTLDDGTAQDRVYVVEARPWFRQWGIWPEDDPGKESLSISQVASIAESPSRLPPAFANELYSAGETGMGYTIFTVCFADGSTLKIETGNAVDFIDYPDGQSPNTVVNVLPHVGRGDPSVLRGLSYAWCLYESEPI